MQCGVAARDLTDQLLNRVGAAKALKVANKRQAAVGLTGPPQLLLRVHLHPERNRLALVRKTVELAAPVDRITQLLKSLGQEPLVLEDRWQDGEMGHGQDSTFSDPSGGGLAVQWPLPPEQAIVTKHPLRLGVMASGSGTNFEALVQACQAGRLGAEVSLLIVNNSEAGALERAKRLGINAQVLDHRLYDSREALDHALISCFQAAQVDLVVMAGWMRIVTEELIRAYPERLINIHPSLLPSFRGAQAIRQALGAGVQLTGCTAHLVEVEVDKGPILVQAAVPVLEGDSEATLSERIHRQEHKILPFAVALAAKRLGLMA